MGLVVSFSNFRKPDKALRRRASEAETERGYYCMRCDADVFHLYPSGRVKCTRCNAVIRNILVTESTDRPDPAQET